MTATAKAHHETPGRAGFPGRRWLVLIMLALAQLMLVLDVTVVNVALPDIGAALHLRRDVLPWVMTTYTLVFGGMMLLGGRIADVAGPRRVMLSGLSLFTLASLGCALSGSATALLAGRAAQGLGAALLSPAALALVTAAFTGPARGRALAVWGALAGAGTALGVTLGGVLTSALGWQWIFAINVPIGAVILIALPFLVPAPAAAAQRNRLDVPGALLVTAATAAVIYGLVNAGSHGWAAASTLVPLVAGLGGWAAFTAVERATPTPLLRIGLLRERPVAAGAFLMLVATGLMIGGFFLGSFTLQRADGYGALRVGLSFLPTALGVVAGAQGAGHLLSRVPARTVATAGFALAAAGEATTAAVHAPAALIAGLAVAALGIGATFVTAFTAALATAGPDGAGVRSAIVNTFHELGGAFGVAVLSTVAGAALTAARPRVGDFTTAFAVAAIAAGISAVVSMMLVPTVVRPAGAGGHH